MTLFQSAYLSIQFFISQWKYITKYTHFKYKNTWMNGKSSLSVVFTFPQLSNIYPYMYT